MAAPNTTAPRRTRNRTWPIPKQLGNPANLEAELGRPVLTANQVLLWAALRATGADPATVKGYGRLFATPR